jgi:type I restriction enzyme S subunit
MGSEYPYVKLGDHVDLATGPAFKSANFSETGTRLARGDNVKEGVFHWGEKEKFWPELTEDLERYLLAEGDVLIGMDGSKVGKNWVKVRSKDLPCLLVQRVARLRTKSTFDTGLLPYVIGSRVFREYVDRVKTGTSIPHISGGQIRDFEIPLPPLPEQKAIAHILGTLDDKIELNRRMNATLEGMAQALFKSWFVDFDPVIDNALAAGNPIPDEFTERAEVRKNALANGTTNRETAKDFPDAFQFTEELGWIPEGWQVAKAEDLITRHKVKQKFTKKNALEAGPVPIFDQGAGLLLGYSDLPADQDSSKENPKFIFGDHTCITHLSTKPFSVGPNVIPLSAKTHAPYWTYYAVKDLQEFQEYRRHWMEFSIKETVLPQAELASVFDSQARGLRASMELNDETSKTLTRLRDTLLPKLISAELRTDNTEGFAHIETQAI